MQEKIHILSLFAELTGNIRLYTTKAVKNIYDIPRTQQLSAQSEPSTIPKGKYLFIQDIKKTASDAQWEAQLEAAELLWLESLWQEIPLTDNTVYIRLLQEDSKEIFQVFRPIDSASQP